jgi:NADPH:quinone reductase-like Zn-dependent oxidoreductase
MLISRQRRAGLETLARLIDAGQLTPVTGKTYPLHQAPDAMRDLRAGHARGKLALTMTGAG